MVSLSLANFPVAALRPRASRRDTTCSVAPVTIHRSSEACLSCKLDSRSPNALRSGIARINSSQARSQIAKRTRSVRVVAAADAGALAEGDVVTVIGASGNVGKLVALRLATSGKFKVRGTARDVKRAGEFLGDCDVELFTADTKDAGSLKDALEGANCVIVCTGVTAFKTKVWDNGNTPDAVDHLGVKNVVDTWTSANPAGALKRFCLMSSIGVTRRSSFPYVILNGGGVLDAKQKGEDAVTSAAQEFGFEYTIVRPGQLTGGPYSNNKYLGTLFQIDKSNKQRVVMDKGDKIVGDTVRSTLAEVIAQSIESPGTAGLDFVVINEKGEAPTTEQLQSQFLELPTSGGQEGAQGPRLELVSETIQQAFSNLTSGKLFKKDD